jgi:hypothetical protein
MAFTLFGLLVITLLIFLVLAVLARITLGD